MGAPSVVVLALAALLAAPLGAAQSVAQQPSLTLDAEDAIRYLLENETVAINMTATYTAAPPDYSATDGVRVRFEVVSAPAWLDARPEPVESRFFFAPAAGPSQQVAIPFRVVATPIAGVAADGRDNEVVVRAVTDPTRVLREAEAEMALYAFEYRDVGAQRVNGTAPTPAAAPDIPDAGSASAYWRAGEQTPVSTQSRHEDELTGGEGLFMGFAAALGGYGGWRLKRRLA